jgi:hypothetical protein
MSVQDLGVANDYPIKCGSFQLLMNPAVGDVLTSDAVGNGTWQTPSAAGLVPTIIRLVGSGSGTLYSLTDSSGNYVDVDGANLKTTFVLPAGWKAIVWSRLQFWQIANSASAQGIAIVDTTTSTVLDAFSQNGSTNRVTPTLTLMGVISSAGSHTVSLQYANSGAVVQALGNNAINSTLSTSNFSANTPVVIIEFLRSN